MNNAIKKAMEKAEKKQAKMINAGDPFAISDLAELDDQIGDIEEAKRKAEEEAAKKVAYMEEFGKFITQIFPHMAALVEKRESVRGLNDKLAIVNNAIDVLLARKKVADVTKTAFIVAVANIETGVKDPKILFEELKDAKLLESVSVDVENPHFSINLKKYNLTFKPLKDYRVQVMQMLRERFGAIERAKTKAIKAMKQELWALKGLSPRDLSEGKAGTFCYFRPYKETTKGNGSVWRDYPGWIAGESDGRKITAIGGTGGCNKIATDMCSAGLSLSVEDLNQENFWVKGEELKPLRPFYLALKDIADYAEEIGDTPEIAEEMKSWKKPGMMLPETFFATDKHGNCLVTYDGLWKWYHEAGRCQEKNQRSGDLRQYDPMANVFAILSRDKEGKVFFSKIPGHIENMFEGVLGKNLEDSKNQVRGPAASFYRWVKGKHAPN